MAEFSAKPRSRPLFGRERTWAFTTRVQAAVGGTRNLHGEIVGKALIPSSVLTAVLVIILVIAAIAVLVAVLGGSPEEGVPPEAPAATATSVEEGPAPTEPPEATQPPEPTQPPPEPTQPPPEPTEPPQEPPTEPPGEQPTEPPSAEHLPSEPEDGESPCAPIAGILFLAPLLVIGKRERDARKAGK